VKGIAAHLGLVLVASALLAAAAPRGALAQTAIETDTTIPPPPPTGVTASDTRDDPGQSITIRWSPPQETPGASPLTGFEVRRIAGAASASADEAGVVVGTTAAAESSFVDTRRDNSDVAPIRDGAPYRYQIVAIYGGDDPRVEPAARVASDWSSAAVARPSFFHADRRVAFAILIVYVVLLNVFIGSAKKGRSLFIRKIAGLSAIEEAVGRATEMGKAVLYVPGTQEVTDIQTIYSMVILHSVAKTVARYGTPLIVPIGKAFALPLAEETVRQGYLDGGHPEAYDPRNVRYLSDEQFAFTAGVDGIMLREKPAANLFLGAFYAESLILAETGFSTGAIQIAGTANIHQLPFFVVACDYTLIGEEFFAATAYLSREPRLLGSLKAGDWMKALIIAALIAGFALISTHVAPNLADLFVVQ
jgi:hypothetical protein